MRDLCTRQEGHPILRKAQQALGQPRYEVEDVIAYTGAEDKQRNDELHQHAHEDGVPLDMRPVLARRPEHAHKHQHAKQRHGAVVARVVERLGGGEGADEVHADDEYRRQRRAQLGRDKRDKAHGGVLPEGLYGLEEEADREVDGEDAQGDAQPEEEGDDPVLVGAVEHQ